MSNMWSRFLTWCQRNPLVIVCAVIAVLVVALVVFPVPQEKTFLAPRGDDDRFAFGGDRVIGQAFIPPKGLTEIVVPVGTEGELRGPLILHLREQWNGEDVRVATVYALEGDVARFTFAPLVRSASTMLWLLEAPNSTPETFWVYREKDETQTSGAAYVNQKGVTGGFGYTLVKRLPLLAVWFGPSPLEEHWHISHTQPWEYHSLLVGVLAAVLWWPIRRYLPRITRYEEIVILAIMAATIIAHLPLSQHMPLINDEGSYMQDVLQAKPSFIPLRDYLTKGPFYLVVLKVWEIITPNTILAWRLLPAISWAVATGLLWLFMMQLQIARPIRLLAALLMGLTPAAVALTTPLLLQTTALPFMIGSWIVLLTGTKRGSRLHIIVATLLITLAFHMRVSMAIGAVVGILLIWWSAPKQRLRLLLTYIISGLIFFGISVLLFIAVLGWERALVAVNAEAILIAQHRASVAAASEEAAEPAIRRLVAESRTLWRSSPLLLVGIFLAPLLIVHRKPLWVKTGASLVIVTLLYYVYQQLRDMEYLLPAGYMIMQVCLLLLFFGGALLSLLLLFTQQLPELPRIRWQWIVVTLVWLVAVVWLHLAWGRFRQNYLIEFIPPLALLSAWGIHLLQVSLRSISSRVVRGVLTSAAVAVVAATLYQGAVVAWEHPHTGTISIAGITEFTREVKKHVPEGTEIFTAQPNITALASRPIIFGNSHPGWYRDSRLGTIPKNILDLLFVSEDTVTRYLEQEAQFVAYEYRTFQIYFEHAPDRKKILDEQFTKIFEVENDAGGGTLELYQRK